MSEHVIEDLVADSQDGFDCSFTHFRVRDILLRRGYVYRFPLDRHPDHAERSAHWDALVDPPFLHCDAGTDLWRRMVSVGELRGPDVDPPSSGAGANSSASGTRSAVKPCSAARRAAPSTSTNSPACPPCGICAPWSIAPAHRPAPGGRPTRFPWSSPTITNGRPGGGGCDGRLSRTDLTDGCDQDM